MSRNTAVLSPDTIETKPETPDEETALDCQSTQHFVGGPFDGRCYHEKLAMPKNAPEGTSILSIPNGADFVAAMIWGRATVYQTKESRPSNPAQYVNYRNGVNGRWHYLPYSVR
jgi:hypothetical protein